MQPFLWPFVWDYPSEPVPEETFTHSYLSWLSIILYQLPPSTTIHSILPVQFTCLTVFILPLHFLTHESSLLRKVAGDLNIFLPPPKKEVMFLVRSVCLSVRRITRKLVNGFWRNFLRGRAWLKDQVKQFWWRSGSRFRSGSPKSEIRIVQIGGGLCSLSAFLVDFVNTWKHLLLLSMYCCCELSPKAAVNNICVTCMQNYSYRFTFFVLILCLVDGTAHPDPSSKLHFWCHSDEISNCYYIL